MNWKIIKHYPPPALEQSWFEFLPASDYPSHYTSPGFFSEHFPGDQQPFAVLAMENEKILGVATGIEAGKRIASGLAVRPQISVCKASDQSHVAETLQRGFLELADETDSELVTIFSHMKLPAFAENDFAEKQSTGGDEVLFLDLSNGAKAVFKGFSQSRRSDLRKAMRENLIEISLLETEAELEELYQIHLDWSERKNLAPEPWEAMLVNLSEPNYRRIFVARYQNKIVAGSYFRFCPGGLFEYAANNSIPEYRHLRPNDLLVWRALEWACARGFKTCSLGASHLFLRRFGGELRASWRYRLDRTFLKKHERSETVKDLALSGYLALPVAARQRIKQLIGRK